MSKLTDEDIVKLATLSKIAMDDAERKKILNELNGILEFVDKLKSIDTAGVEPTAQVSGLTNVTRTDDIVDYGATGAELLKGANRSKNGYIQVPKVI